MMTPKDIKQYSFSGNPKYIGIHNFVWVVGWEGGERRGGSVSVNCLVGELSCTRLLY